MASQVIDLCESSSDEETLDLSSPVPKDNTHTMASSSASSSPVQTRRNQEINKTLHPVDSPDPPSPIILISRKIVRHLKKKSLVSSSSEEEEEDEDVIVLGSPEVKRVKRTKKKSNPVSFTTPKSVPTSHTVDLVSSPVSPFFAFSSSTNLEEFMAFVGKSKGGVKGGSEGIVKVGSEGILQGRNEGIIQVEEDVVCSKRKPDLKNKKGEKGDETSPSQPRRKPKSSLRNSFKQMLSSPLVTSRLLRPPVSNQISSPINTGSDTDSLSSFSISQDQILTQDQTITTQLQTTTTQDQSYLPLDQNTTKPTTKEKLLSTTLGRVKAGIFRHLEFTVVLNTDYATSPFGSLITPSLSQQYQYETSPSLPHGLWMFKRHPLVVDASLYLPREHTTPLEKSQALLKRATQGDFVDLAMVHMEGHKFVQLVAMSKVHESFLVLHLY